MKLTASKIRQDIRRVLDHVLGTGELAAIDRHGRRLRIVDDEPPSRLDRLVRRTDVVIGDSEDFVHMDWAGELRR